MFITVILFIIFIFLLLQSLKNKDEDYWRRRNVHYETPLPVFGNIFDVIFYRKSFMDVLKELYFKNDQPFFGMWTFNEPQLIIKSPDLIRQMLVKDFDYFQDRNIACKEEVDEFAANMTFFMENQKWKMIRAVTSAALSSTQIKRIYPQIQRCADDLVKHINSLNGDVEAKKLCIGYTVETVCSALFGVDLHCFQKNNVEEGLDLDLNISSEIPIVCHVFKSSLAHLLKIKPVATTMMNKFLTFLIRVLEKRKSTDNWKRMCLFDAILSNKYSSKDLKIMSLAAEYLMAAYQSTSTIIALVLYELALNYAIQDKLREEIMSSLDSDGDISYSTLNTMNYLSKVVYETLRKYPVVPMLGRRCVKDYTIPNTAVTIEKGINILIPLNALQNDPKYYPQPEVFDPERFSEEDVRDRSYFCYLPFGEGPRKCIGMKFASTIIKLAVVHVLKNFEIELGEKVDAPLQFKISNTFLMIDDKVYVRFKPIT